MSESPRSPRTDLPRSRFRRGRTATALIAAGGVLATTALALLPGTAGASSHREAPLIADHPAYDNTDVYAFSSPDNEETVTFVSNWWGLQEPNGGPTFYPWAEDARYNIKVDADGDALPDITYRFEFTTEDLRDDNNTFLYNVGVVETLDDPDLLFRQYWKLTKVTAAGEEVIGEGQAAPSNTGPTSFPDYADIQDQATYELANGGKTMVGQTEDPFFLDLRVFDLLYGTDLSETGQDTLAGYNVNTVVLQIPKGELALNKDPQANPVIGVWSTTDRNKNLEFGGGAEVASGDFVQVSRLGNPLVNEVVFDIGLKDAFNAISPDVDATVPEAVDRVLDPEVPRLVEAIYGIPAPATPRNDLVEIFLTGIATNAPTLDGSEAPIQADLNSQVLNADVDPAGFVPSEMLRLNMAVPVSEEPSRLGVLGGDLQGFPNGRRLADDVVDIGLLALQGAALDPTVLEGPLAGGDGVDANDQAFRDEFPYVNPASNLNVNDPANTQPDTGPAGAVPPVSTPGPGVPGPALVTGLAAVALLGAGFTMIARRRETVAPVAS
ncbi:MAG TPA: DUF4331 domain-containing protein [Pseudonocardia sp.]|jgi:hypothetical protein|nr:DUF4331 domain-containing protein [Pseudonocardia sp.]